MGTQSCKLYPRELRSNKALEPAAASHGVVTRLFCIFIVSGSSAAVAQRWRSAIADWPLPM
jgi:hypothetical protein